MEKSTKSKGIYDVLNNAEKIVTAYHYGPTYVMAKKIGHCLLFWPYICLSNKGLGFN